MFELRQRGVDIFRSWVNPFISLMFVGSFAFGAFLIVYDTAFGNNPVADAFAAAIERETVLSDK
jgi:hypothetical protein